MIRPDDLSPLVKQYLEDVCSFVLDAHPSSLSMLQPDTDLTVIGGDGMGGSFYAWDVGPREEGRPIVYLSQYGEASRFADSFLDAIRIVTAYPTDWGEALVAAHNKSRELFDLITLESDAELDDDEQAGRQAIVDSLGLDLAGVAGAFFDAVRRDPPFAPLLQSEGGPTRALSFSERPYPK